jgi:hypothetical protein
LVQSKQGAQLSPLAAIQVEPTTKQQPALAPYQIPRGTSPAKELGSPHLIHGLPRTLQNVKPVVNDAALGCLLFQTLSKRLPHIQASGSNRTSLKRTQRLLEKRLRRLL